MARLAPDVLASLDETPQGSPLAEDRFRQFDAVARLLRRVCLEKPLVIVLDDAHWADLPSLLLLRHLARGLSPDLIEARVARALLGRGEHGAPLAGLGAI